MILVSGRDRTTFNYKGTNMTDVKREGNIGGPSNPKQGAGSGVTKTSSTTTDEGPVTTQATGQGNPIVTNDGRTAEVPAPPKQTEEDSKKSKR